jgi:hypothetical protein
MELIELNENIGYLYCMSNPCMPGILKCGFTLGDVYERAKQLYTTGVPLPFKIEISKKIKNPREKEKHVHTLLEKYYDRINFRREFFKVDVADVLDIFNLIDGEYMDLNKIVSNEIELSDDSSSEDSSIILQKKLTKISLNELFKDGTLIRHKKSGFCEYAIYDKSKNKLFRSDENSNILDIGGDENIFTSLNSFTTSNYRKHCPYRTERNNAYIEAEFYNNDDLKFHLVKSILG